MEENENQEIINENIQNTQTEIKNNSKFYSILYILISIFMIVFIYSIYTITMNNYHDYFLHEGQGNPPAKCALSFLLITLLFVIAYCIAFIFLFKKFSFRFIIYPLNFFTLFMYYWFYRFLSVGPAYGWSLFWMAPLLVIGLFITFTTGIISTLNKKEQKAGINNPDFSSDVNTKIRKMNKASIVTLIWSVLMFVFWISISANIPNLSPIHTIIRIIPIILLVVSIFIKNNIVKIILNIIVQLFILFTLLTIISLVFIILNCIYIVQAIIAISKENSKNINH